MTLEELQDYALSLEKDKELLESEKAEQATKMTELEELNKTLQQRNNKLFMQVESGVEVKEPEAPPPTPTCEEFAKTLKGVIRK